MTATTSGCRQRALSRAAHGVAVALCAFSLSAAASRVSADAAAASPAAAEPADYAEAVEAALSEHERGNFEEARAHFLRAHELHPNARTLRGLGKVEFELRNYGESVHYLREALDSQIKPLDAALRVETERLLERARVYVGEVHVDVDPGSATVSVDGVTVASGPRVSLSLIVGDHILEFRALGRVSERRSIRVRGGDETVIQVVLPVPLEAQEATRVTAPNRDEPVPLRKKWWLWTSVGAVVAGALVAGLVVGLRDKEKVLYEAPATSPNTPPGVVLMALGRQ